MGLRMRNASKKAPSRVLAELEKSSSAIEKIRWLFFANIGCRPQQRFRRHRYPVDSLRPYRQRSFFTGPKILPLFLLILLGYFTMSVYAFGPISRLFSKKPKPIVEETEEVEVSVPFCEDLAHNLLPEDPDYEGGCWSSCGGPCDPLTLAAKARNDWLLVATGKNFKRCTLSNGKSSRRSLCVPKYSPNHGEGAFAAELQQSIMEAMHPAAVQPASPGALEAPQAPMPVGGIPGVQAQGAFPPVHGAMLGQSSGGGLHHAPGMLLRAGEDRTYCGISVGAALISTVLAMGAARRS